MYSSHTTACILMVPAFIHHSLCLTLDSDMALSDLSKQSAAFVADASDTNARDALQENLKQTVEACSHEQPLPVELIACLNNLLYSTVQNGTPAISEASQLLLDVLGSLPEVEEMQTDENAEDQVLLEKLPTSSKEVLQMAILDVLWTLDSVYEANGEFWPLNHLRVPAGTKVGTSYGRMTLRKILVALNVSVQE